MSESNKFNPFSPETCRDLANLDLSFIANRKAVFASFGFWSMAIGMDNKFSIVCERCDLVIRDDKNIVIAEVGEHSYRLIASSVCALLGESITGWRADSESVALSWSNNWTLILSLCIDDKLKESFSFARGDEYVSF